MKRAMILSGALLAAACGGSTPPPAAPEATVAQWDAAAATELQGFMERMNAAWQSGNIDEVASSLADDGFLTSFDLDMSGQPISFTSKQAILDFAKTMSAQMQQMKAAGATMSMTHEPIQCQATSTFGVCIDQFQATMTMGDKTEVWSMRGTGTARKGPSGWQATHWHGSLAKMPPMPPAPPPPPVWDAAMLNQKDLKWMAPPGAPAGLKVAVASGDPTKGAFSAMVEFPKNTKFPKHYHSANTWAYVVRGALKIGLDNGQTIEVRQGGVGMIPAKHPHTTESKVGALVFQYTDGPDDMVPVDAPAATPPAATPPAATPPAATPPAATPPRTPPTPIAPKN